MRLQNNRSLLTIVTVGLMLSMLFPSGIILQQVNAQQVSDPNIPKGISPNVVSQLKDQQKYVQGLIQEHKDWISVGSCSRDKCTIDYVGPKDKNPFYGPNLHGIGAPHKKGEQSSGLPLSLSYPVQAQVAPTSYSSSDFTVAYHIEQSLSAIASTKSNVDFLQNLNTFNQDTTHWMQSSIAYDIADLTQKGVGWYGIFDSYTIGGSEDSGFPVYKSITSGSSDTIDEDTYADDNGVYTMYVTDTSTSSSVYVNASYGDGALQLELGRTTSGGVPYDSGTMSEEASSNGNSWSWGTQYYYLTYWYCSTCSYVASVNGWNSPDVSGSVTVNTYNNPAEDTMKY
ncbi:MAG: hypothetical protein KGH83_01650 [Thaumarchaeota archaeon]|nr:hypothetical protein [Nitrososphaerota archaeon]